MKIKTVGKPFKEISHKQILVCYGGGHKDMRIIFKDKNVDFRFTNPKELKKIGIALYKISKALQQDLTTNKE